MFVLDVDSITRRNTKKNSTTCISRATKTYGLSGVGRRQLKIMNVIESKVEEMNEVRFKEHCQSCEKCQRGIWRLRCAEYKAHNTVEWELNRLRVRNACKEEPIRDLVELEDDIDGTLEDFMADRHFGNVIVTNESFVVHCKFVSSSRWNDD